MFPGLAIGHLATVSPKGMVQVNPVWFATIEPFDVFAFSVTKTRQKYKNLMDNPNVAMSVADPVNPYTYLELRGHVVSVAPDTGLVFINAESMAYLGQDPYPWHQPDDERVVVTVGIQSVTSMGGE